MAKTNRWCMICPTCKEMQYWTGSCGPPPPCPICQLRESGAKAREEKAMKDDVIEAMYLIEEMGDIADEIPEAGEDFATDVLEKAKSIGKTIERANSVTAPQLKALSNMRDGLARWLRD